MFRVSAANIPILGNVVDRRSNLLEVYPWHVSEQEDMWVKGTSDRVIL